MRVTKLDIDRIERISAADPGYCALAVHGLQERIVREVTENPFRGPSDTVIGYGVLHHDLRNLLLDNKQHGEWINLSVLDDIKHHRSTLTNGVRHVFETLDEEEARVAVSHLRDFLELIGELDRETDERLELLLKGWGERRPRLITAEAYAQLNNELDRLRQYELDHGESDESKWELEQKIRDLSTQLNDLHHQLEQQARKAARNKERADEARQRRFQVEQEIKRVRCELESKQEEFEKTYTAQEKYVELLKRLTNLTRSRRQYEERVLRLTAEQTEVLDQIDLKSDFLLRGAAGTGKSLVLLKALEKAIRARRELLISEEEMCLVLLTYQRSLVSYNTYLSQVLGIEETEARIDTLTTFLKPYFEERDLPRSGNPNPYWISGFRSLEHSVLSNHEIRRELEDFIWANNYSYTEYVEDMIPRKGLGRRLGKIGREEIWELKERIEEKMVAENKVTKNFSRLLLLRRFEQSPPEKELAAFFLDEVQDVTAVELQLLRYLTDGPILMAGDEQQQIFSSGSIFARSDIDLRGRTKYLQTNFRNTVEIHDYAHGFLGRLAPLAAEAENPYGFRHGPIPELFKSGSGDSIDEMVARRTAFFVSELGYEPEMICVASPKRLKNEDDPLRNAFEKQSLSLMAIDGDFRFDSVGAVRFSTLHGLKGLSFPVVILHLPEIPVWAGIGYSEEQATTMVARLLFVSMTRAMEHLNIFLGIKEISEDGSDSDWQENVYRSAMELALSSLRG